MEALVALALLAGTGMALFGWIQQSLQTATRLRIAEQEARLLLSARAIVDRVNPTEQPEGSHQASGLSVSWRAELVEPARRNASFMTGEPGPWQIGLYRVQVSAHDDVTGSDVRFVQLRTGLRRLSSTGSAL